MRTTEKFLVVDIETANSTQDALAYDIGFCVTDRKGNFYEGHSFIVKDIFVHESELMKSAYYGEKVPQYLQGIKEEKHVVASLYEVQKKVKELMKEYKIKKVFAYNANFDNTGLNKTLRWVTKSKFRYFFPFGTEIHCIWNMACQVICTQKRYFKFCEDNNFISESGNLKTSAEVVYAYLKKDADFEEEHKGFDDVLIETEILAHCYKQHKKMETKINRACWRIPTKAYKSLVVA